MSVWVYPEGKTCIFFNLFSKSFLNIKNKQGTRNTKLQLLPLKKGAFHLAVKSQVSFFFFESEAFKPYKASCLVFLI